MLTVALVAGTAVLFGSLHARLHRRPQRPRWLAAVLLTTMVLSMIAGVGTPVTAVVTPTVPLGAAAQFAVLGGSTVTNTGNSLLEGSLGLWPGTSITGLPGLVLAPGTVENTNSAALQAQVDLTTAFSDAAARPVDAMTAADLVGLTLARGVYSGPAKSALGLSGDLVLDGAGDPTSVFIFQTDSTLTTAPSSSVRLINGAQACNVFWVVGSSATLGTGSSFSGNVLASDSVTVTNGVTVQGRVLARNAAVTLDSATISRPTCDTPSAVVPTRVAVPMIVTAESVIAARDLVAGVGGVVIRDLPIIDGVLSDLTSAATAVLSDVPGVVVTPNVEVRVMSTNALATRPPASVFAEASGAVRLAATGEDGRGVNVAVLDTGISFGPDFRGHLIGGVDLSGEGNPYQDSYGHGTFVAGLIGGNGESSAGRYAGEAPGVGLAAVKVAGRSGITDLATVIEGVQWTVANRAALDIRVLNMSLGVALDMPSRLNPLDRAVKVAWNAGIVVVVSAGNDGPGNGTILSPGDAPEVITVGALDDNGTVVSADDTMTEFSSVGPTKVDGWFKPDLVASGRSVVSVRAANSTIDLLYPGARIDTAYFAGSGSSFSSAITAGAAALVIGALPRVTPDVVKARLLATAAPGPVGNPFVDGHGALDVYTAATTAAIKLAQPPSLSAIAPGGSVSLLTTWEQSSWNPAMWSSGLWTGPPWTGSNWAGSSWNGSSWNGSSWNGAAWVGSNWAGSNWAGSNWAGSSWNGSNWAGSNWAGSSWGDAAPG